MLKRGDDGRAEAHPSGGTCFRMSWEDLEVKVINFGLAKITAEAANEMDLSHGAFVGTPAFASLEQFGSQSADARSDIYSLGATLWFARPGKLRVRAKRWRKFAIAKRNLRYPPTSRRKNSP